MLHESGQLLRPEVMNAAVLAGELPMDVIHTEVYHRFHSDDLLTQRLPNLQKGLLIGRRILAALVNALQARALAEPSLADRELFLLAAPLISYNSLENELHSALLHLSTKSIRALVSSFIFGGNTLDSRDLWFRPFILEEIV